ncbi:MAG: SpoIIE family protein phosphatase [Nocardioides sp.]
MTRSDSEGSEGRASFEAAPGPFEGPSGRRRAEVARRLVPVGEGHPALNRLAELAARLLGSASAQVSLLTDVQTIAAGEGLAPGAVGSQGPLEESLCTVTVAGGTPLVVLDAPTDDRVSALPPVASGAVGAYLGVPLVASTGESIGALCVFDPGPRSWTPADVTLLQRLAEPVVAELELAALNEDYETGRVVWELAVDAAGVGAFDWHLASGELRWDARLLELFGLDRSTFGATIQAFNDTVHPEDLPRVTQVLNEAIAGCGTFTVEYRVVLPGGGVRWIAARGRALCDESGVAVRVLGAAYDTTAVQEGEGRVARVLESMPTAFFSLDHAWCFSYVNAEAEKLLGAGREALVGGHVWELFPDAVGSEFETEYRRAARTGEPVAFDAYYPPPLDAWYEVRAWPSPDGLSVYFLDITARREAEEQARLAARRSALLARVTDELTGTLEAEEAVGRLASLVIPDQADWCVVTLVDDEGHPDWRRRLRDVGWWHADPAMRPLVDRYTRVRIPALLPTSYVAEALDGPAPVLLPGNAADAISAVLAPGEARDICRELDPATAVVVPLRGPDRTVGLLTAFRGRGRGPFSREDLEVLTDVAARAGLALDNARLFAQQRDLAETLQRSLLTAPPEPDGAELVVRYEAAGQAAQIGGDWYDAFLQPDGDAVLVIGDVVGHDTEAAAAMGQVRSLLRAIAALTGDGPAEVLRGVDKVMETLQVATTATAVVARLERDETGRATRLRWSNAGHPPPIAIHPDGRVVVLAAAGYDLMLGLDPETPRAETTANLEEGAVVMLYTDGLVERRGQSIDDGLELLCATLRDLVAQGLTLDDVCDQVLRRMLPDRPEDDVALVAVRLREGGAPA